MGNNRLGSNPTIEKYARLARKAGFTVEITGSNHLRWRTPDGKATYFSALTFGDPRRVKAVRKFLVSHGLQLDK